MKVLLAFFLFAFADSVPHYPIEKGVERVLPLVNNFIGLKGWEIVPLPDFGVDGIPIFVDVNLQNMTTIVRTGTCEMWADGEKTLNIKLNLGLENMKASVVLAPAQAPVEFAMKGANVELLIKFESIDYPKPDCDTKWDSLKITTLGDITVKPSSTNWLPPEKWASPIVEYYNNLFNGNGKYSIKNLDNKLDLCNIPEIMYDIFRL